MEIASPIEIQNKPTTPSNDGHAQQARPGQVFQHRINAKSSNNSMINIDPVTIVVGNVIAESGAEPNCGEHNYDRNERYNCKIESK